MANAYMIKQHEDHRQAALMETRAVESKGSVIARMMAIRAYQRVVGKTAILLACALIAEATQAATEPGFKELHLGMTLPAAKKARQLACKRAGHTVSLPPTTVAASRSLRVRADELRARAWSGDVGCVARKSDTVGGMRISELQLLFAQQTLQRITIDIGDDGRTHANGRGGSDWFHPDLMDLIDAISRKYGTPVRAESQDCRGGIGGCLRAARAIVLTWRPAGAEITLAYRNKQHYGSPQLVFTSAGWLAQQTALKIEATAVDQRAALIEQAAIERAAAKRGDDI